MKQSLRDSPIRRWRGLLIIGAIIAAAIGLILLVRRLFRSSQQGQRGFTLLEILLGVVIIALIGVAAARAIDTSARTNAVLDEKVQGTTLASSYLEGIRQIPYDASSSPYASVAAGITKPLQYSVSMLFSYSGDGETWSSSNNSGEYKLQKVTIQVSRTDGSTVFSMCTLRADR